MYRLKPRWRGEKLYQETRRLIIAVWQSIVYTEWLPVIFGGELYRQLFVERVGIEPDGGEGNTSQQLSYVISFVISFVFFVFRQQLLRTLKLYDTSYIVLLG